LISRNYKTCKNYKNAGIQKSLDKIKRFCYNEGIRELKMKVIKKEFVYGGYLITFENGEKAFFQADGLIK